MNAPVDTPAVIDTSILIDHLRGHPPAARLLERERTTGRLHASEMTRLEVLAGVRRGEEASTGLLLGAITWHPVDEEVATGAGTLGRRWLPSHHTIDSADLAIAATAVLLGARLLTMNVRHFPMFPGLTQPY